MGSNMTAQLRCSLWRHYLARLRQWPWIVGSILVALAPFVLLAILKNSAPPIHRHKCHFPSRTLSSETSLGVIQSFVCTLNNQCYQNGEDDLLDAYPGAPINKLMNSSLWPDGDEGGGGKGGMMAKLVALPDSVALLANVAHLFTNPNLTALMENGLRVRDIIKSPRDLNLKLTSGHNLSSEVVSTILGAKLNISRIMSLVGYRDVKKVVCSSDLLSQFLVTSVRSEVDNISTSLCDLPAAEVANITQIFIDSLDPKPLFDKVTEVLAAIEGYEAENLVRKVGGLLVSLGRLEALVPLASSMTTVTSAFQPYLQAMEALTQAGWDSESLQELMSMVESLTDTTTHSKVARHTTRSIKALLEPQNLSMLATDQETGEASWKAVLEKAGSSMETLNTGFQEVEEKLRQRPVYHTLLMGATTILPRLLRTYPPVFHSIRIGEALDNFTSRLLPEVAGPVTRVLTVLQVASLMATNITQAVDIQLSMVRSSPHLPPSALLTVLASFTNFSLVQDLITEDRLTTWACSRSSWVDLNDADWWILKAKFCSEGGARDLERITALLRTPLNQSEMGQMYSQQPTKPSQVLESIMKLSGVIHELLKLDDHSQEGAGATTIRTRRSIIEGIDDLLSRLPPIEHNKLKAFQDDAQLLKHVIKTLTRIYLNQVSNILLVEDLERINPHFIRLLTDSRSVERLTGLAASTLHSIIQISAVTQHPWVASDVLLSQHLKELLFTVLPKDAMEVVENVYDVLEIPTVMAAPPFPQLVGVLNASYNILDKVYSAGDPWAWCEGGCPYTTPLVKQVGVLPRLLAIPYLWGITGVTTNMMALLTNETAWRYYPCSDTTITDLFPPASTVGDLPASWSQLETIKKDVQGLERYFCENFTAITDELTSDTQLTQSVKALIEDLSPGEVDVGSALRLVKSFSRLLTSRDPRDILDVFTTSWETTIIQEFQDSFTEVDVNPQMYMRMMLEMVDQVMVWMGKEVGTQQVASTVQYLMYHTHTVTTALTHLLQGEELTLSSLMTVQEDFPPLQLLRQGPVGTADFLLKELTSFATSFVLVEQKETWVEWAAGACNRSVGVSVVVEVVCHYVLHPHTPDVVFSNLTTAVIKALTEYGKPGIQVPQVSSADLYDQLWILVRQLEQFDFNKPNNLSTLEHFWDVTVKEARLLYTGFLDFQKQWPWVVADAAVGQSEELQLLLRKCYTVVSWVNDRLPHTPDHLMDSIPPSIINLHNVLNSSWIDLLDGLHHNIFLNPMLFNQTLQEFCSSASSLVEPVEGSNQFQESVGEVCDVLSHITPGSFNTWLQYEQLMNDLNNNTWQPSTFKLYNTSRTVVAKVVTLLRGVNILEENRVSDATSSPSYVSFSPVLPSYLLQDNWDILMRRIAERGEGSNLTSVMPAVEMVLGWLGANQGSLNTFITSSTLRVYIKSILAHDLQELLQDYPALWQLTETLTQYMPEALKDVINTLSARPVVMSRLLLSLENTENSSSVCGLDLQQVGDDFHSFKTRLCQVNPGELLQELRHIMGLQVSQNPWDLSLEEVINSSVVASSLLMEQVQNGSLLEKFSRPVEYLGLEKWAKLPQEVFNITLEEMLDNSTMIVATVLKPLVELSREPTREGMVVREALKILDIYLRWSKLILSVSRGGDIWRALKEAYDDKPVVIKFFEMVQNLPEFVIEYINFFGNYSVMAHAVLLHRDTPCNLHLFLLDGYYKQQLGDNVSTILTEVLEFVCDPHQIRLLGPQLLPDSSPVIANVTMEVDAAMLALLIDSIGWDVVYFVNGTFYEGDLQAPSWMDSHKWEEVRVKLKNLFAVPIKRMVAGAIGLGLNAFGAYLGDGYMASVIGPVYHLTTRLTESINRSTGILDTNILVAGLGAVKEMHDLAIPRLSRLLGLALWFPESKAYYSLVSGVAQSAVKREMCRDGVDKFLFHPGLDEEDWKALQKMLCSYNYLDVYKGVQPLFNTSDIMSGVTIDWMKVYSNLNRFMDKISLVDPWQLQDFLIKTPHMMGMRNLTTVQKYVRGIFIGMSALQKWMSEDDNPATRHTYALALIKINAALRPITKDGSASLYERLLDPQLFKQLLKDYSYVVQDIQKETTQLNLQNQMGSMLMEEMDPEDTAAALHGAMKNTTYAHLLSQLKTVTLNVLGSIMPAEMTPKTAVTVVDFLLTVASNIVQNMAGVFGVVKTPACYYSLSREEFEGPLQQVASWLSFTEKHLDQWDGYVDLTCGISKLNLTHTLLKLLQDFDWENDIKQMMTDDEVKNQTLSCDIVFDHFANLSQQVKAIVTQYIQDETARQHFLTCLTPAHNSTTLPQFLGLLTAIGDLFSLKSSLETAEELAAAMAALPASSTALQTLGSRITVLVPLEDILMNDFEIKLNFSSVVIDIIKNDLLIDVNRIYGIETREIVSLLSSVKMLKKLVQLRNNMEDTASIVKRSTVISPIVKLYQAIQEMGPETFTENLLQSVNYTYLLSKINNMRMEALLNTDWLATMKVDISAAVGSLSQLSKLGAVMDLSKIITGEVDPVTFLTGSVQLLQMKLWIDLAKSFSKILEEGMPLVAGSELEDDLQRVVDGINSLQAAKNLGIVDFTIPTYSFITNWTEMQQYMEEDLMMSAEVIEALRHSELNLMALLSLEDVTLEEVICEGSQVERVVTLPRDTQVTPAAISDSLCNSTNAQGLAETFLQHLNLAPLIVTLTNFGINSSLTSHGTTLEEVMDAVNTLVESSVYLPTLTNTFSALRDLRYTLIEPPVSEKLVMNNSQSMLRDITSPSFLTRAGQALCGRSLDLVPDSLGVLSVNFKEKEPNNTEPSSDVCETLYEDIKSLPGGSVLLHFIKPLLMGKIFYTPDNYITQAIIHQANETFAKVEKQQEALKQLQKSTARLATTSSQDSDLQKLKESLQLPWVQSLMQQLLPSSHSISLTEQINYTSPQLTEASEFAKEFSDILEVGVSLLSCLELQRFVPASDEAELLELASHAAKEKMFLAGIVFDDAGETGDTETKIPAHLTYTLRVDYEKSPSTFHLGPKFWQPGAYAHMALHMKYLQGFLQLQETIEEAILKLQHKNSNFSKTAASLKSQDNDFLSVIDKDIGNKSKFLRSKNMKQLSLGVNNLPKTIEPRHLLSRRTKRATTAATLTEEEENLLLNLPVYTKQQPYPCYEKDDFMSMLNSSPVLSCVFSFMAFTIFIMSLISQLVQERESRNRQLQEVMGLRLWLDHLVWFFYSLLHLVIILLVVTFAIKFGGLQPKVDFWVLFTFLFCYGLSIIAFCYLVACLVPSTVLATFVGVMSLLVFSVPFVSITLIQVKTPLSIIRFSCLLPPSAFGFGFQIICQYELLLKGADFNNLWTPPLRGSDMTLGVALVMLLVDTAIFFLISAIVTTFRNACCQLPDLPANKIAPLKGDDSNTKKDAVHVLDLDPGLKQSLKKGLSIVGLRRIFKQRGRSKVAITNLNLELYEGQVLVLLGHNGAGKTTIISMLTRELKPTAGSIQVYGHDISSAWNKARRLIGLCPQQTVLFPFLTVQETLEYYSMLKESTTSMGQIDTNMVLHNMGLFYHRDYLVCHLSEGLSRRLSMAIAFTGNSKLIILDEPTAGVDPAARSAIWEVISNNRAGRTILLTTHHLDEAETLADRVAILHQGRLLCVGSPLALKSEYGLGYSLTLSNRILSEESSSEETADLDNNIKPSIDGTFSVAKKGELWQLLKSYVPNVRLLESVNGEVTYSLPLCDNHGNSNRLSDMFGELEKSLEELGFASLEIRPTSLEDVVIALNTINSIDSHSLTKTRVTPTPQLEKEENLKNTFNFKPQQTQKGVQLGVQRFFALLLKRLLHHGRDWRFYVQMLLLPQLFIILALIGSKCRPVYVNPVALKLTPDMYSAPTTTFTRTLDPTLQPLSDEFLRLSVRQKGSAENWSTCPSHVADYNPGLPHCNVSASNITSLCKCDGERCAVEVADQPSLNDWLLGTRQQHIQSRYGGVTLGVEDPRLNSNLSGAMVWYDNSGYHALPAYLNMLNNARLQRLLGEDYSITVVNKPILFSAYGLGSMSLEQRAADIGIGLLILVSLTVVCSATAGYIVAERVRGERRVLFVAGITRHMYWNANMLWDIMLLLMNVLLTTFILLIFNEQLFIWRENLAAFTLLAILFGLSILPLFYLVEGFFQTEASAVFFFFCSTFGIGFITTLLLIVCEVMKWVKILTDVANVMKYVFLIFPPFTFACGIKDLAVSFTKTSIMASFDVDVYVSPFSWDTKMEGGLGLHYLTLALWTVIGIMVLHCWHKCLRPIPRNTAPAKNLAGAEEDKDVAAERIKIQCGGTSLYDTVLRLVGLGRDFSSPPTTAVSNLFLALRRGECFSLLGLNGAGKTTAFRCLTGDIRPTRGQILVNGLTLEEALALPYPIMSYCPQTHALDPNLTSREALSIMALIRGFPQREIAGVLEQVIKQLGLSGEDNTIIKQLSGGTKRKLSTALTLLGNPLLVLLDEPTTGMDPASRRLVWRAIQSVTQDGRSVLLTSHSMDEVNQLSHRMAIMVNGYFVCMGSPHYLKHKLGDKYTIRLKTNDIEDMTYVVDFLRSQLQDVLLKEQHHLTLVVEVSRHLPLRLIFDTLNSAKSMGVTEYDVSQTTLNEVFRVLTSHQGDGQVPPPPPSNSHEQVTLPMHLLNLHPVDYEDTSSVSTFQTPRILFQPSMLAPVEKRGRTSDDRESLYDNLEVDKQEIYATVGKVSSMRKPSPDLYQGTDSLPSESGSADDSPEEEWTHF